MNHHMPHNNSITLPLGSFFTRLPSFKLLSISLLFVTILSACGPLSKAGLSTQSSEQNRPENITALTTPVISIPVLQSASEPTLPLVTATLTANPTPIPPNTPVWSAYNYTCELAEGGGIMTMNLTWIDRSTSEEGYTVYRNHQVLANLPPNSTAYVDVVFVATSKTVSYSVEAFNPAWRTTTSTITYGCQ